MRKLIDTLILGLLMAGSYHACAVPDIRVAGLFKDKAMIEVDGSAHLLELGETSPEGVKLVSSSSTQATLEFEGKRMVLGLSRHIASGFRSADVAEVRVPPDDRGHYYVSGEINGRSVQFMVDTGATMIAMNLGDAERLGIEFRRGESGAASTAGGMVNTFVVMLPRVSVGGITVHNIPASVIIGDYPADILLGNSFLEKVQMQQQNGVMVLRQKQ